MLAAVVERQLSESELVIRGLYEITALKEAGFDQQLQELLALGCDRFDLDIGIVARIEGSDYEVFEAVNSSEFDVLAGHRFDLADTYCALTLEAGGPIAVDYAGGSNFSRHRAYRATGLEAYIGIPIEGADGVWGTISFSSMLPRSGQFEETDLDTLRLFASWISTEMQRRDTEAELTQARKHLEQLVRTDPLTELKNRRGMAEALEDHARRSRFSGSPLSSVLVDIDDFKQVNDNYGHAAGDRVIRGIAEGIRTCLRPTDVAARIGGDEFLVILPGAEAHEARMVAERIGATVGCLDLVDAGVPFPVTVSIGVAEVPEGAVSVTDILVCTEELLRRSKKAGKNTVSA